MRAHDMRFVMTMWARMLAVACVFATLSTASGEDRPASAPASMPASQPVAPGGLTVAILDFTANSPGSPDLGSQIGEALTAVLSGEPGLTLLDRTTLTRVLQEHELNLSGVVDTNQAIKIGKIVGNSVNFPVKTFAFKKT